jgi:Protein of unknown function (DUF3800)
MHHSKDSKRASLVLAHYIDDSGSHDQSQIVVMGGPVFLQRDFFSFHYEWDRILSMHGVTGPIHMKDFGKNGRLGYLTYDQRRTLFSDLVYLINSRKAYSLTVELDSAKIQSIFPAKKFRKLMSGPALAFYQCMILDSIIARKHPQMSKVAFVVATSDCNCEIVDGHNFIQSYEARTEFQMVGSLTFDTPQNVNALQAADMVAWANRRKGLGDTFHKGFEPLELLTRLVECENRPSMMHFHCPAGEKSAESLAKIVGDPVRIPGKRNPLLKPLPPRKGSHENK